MMQIATAVLEVGTVHAQMKAWKMMEEQASNMCNNGTTSDGVNAASMSNGAVEEETDENDDDTEEAHNNEMNEEPTKDKNLKH